MKFSNDTNWDRTSDLPICSTAYMHKANIYCSFAKFISIQSGGSSYEQQKNVSPLNSRQYSASTSTGGTSQHTYR